MKLRSFIYNQFIIPLTKLCYFEVLSRLPENAFVLDVGVGTGEAMIENKELICSKKLRILGIDINTAYLRACRKTLIQHNLTEQITVQEQSFYECETGGYDAIYFSSSFMLLPDQKAALKKAFQLLKPGGKIYFTQTLHTAPSRWREILKPKLIYFTSIDFGQLTYEQDFFDLLEQSELKLIENSVLKKWRYCDERLVVAMPNFANNS